MATRNEALKKSVSERAKVKDAAVKEAMKRMDSSQPTPTQEENDLAKVGALDLDAKEPDGSGPEAEQQRKVMEARLPGNNPYETRDMDQRSREQGQPARQPRKE